MRKPEPRIAVIRGVCIGGGGAMALCCDLRFAESGARFAVTPAKLGIAYSSKTRGACSTVSAPPPRRTGRTLDAPATLQLHLIDAVFPAAALEDEALATATTLAGNSAASIAVARDFIARAQSGQRAENEATRTAYLDILAGIDISELPHLSRWSVSIGARPAVQRGAAVPVAQAVPDVETGKVIVR